MDSEGVVGSWLRGSMQTAAAQDTVDQLRNRLPKSIEGYDQFITIVRGAIRYLCGPGPLRQT